MYIYNDTKLKKNFLNNFKSIQSVRTSSFGVFSRLFFEVLTFQSSFFHANRLIPESYSECVLWKMAFEESIADALGDNTVNLYTNT